MKILKDFDGVEIIKVSDIVHPNKDNIVERFSFTVNGVDVVAVDDLNICIAMYKDGGEIDDYNYSDIALCSVCGAVLLPDDECYVDYRTGTPICTNHAYMGADDNYHKIIFP